MLGESVIFFEKRPLVRNLRFRVALPGAQALAGFRRQLGSQIWLVQTYKEYFKEITLGKSWREWLADFPKIFSQKRRFLAILSTDFGEKLLDLS